MSSSAAAQADLALRSQLGRSFARASLMFSRQAPQPMQQRGSWGASQQMRGYAQFLRFPARGNSWGARDLDPQQVLWGLIAANGG
jgi:hypothetical protein